MQRCSNDGEELHDEQERDDVGQDGDLLGFAGEHLDDGVADHGKTDAVADGAGDGHGDEHDEHGHDLVDVVEVFLFLKEGVTCSERTKRITSCS